MMCTERPGSWDESAKRSEFGSAGLLEIIGEPLRMPLLPPLVSVAFRYRLVDQLDVDSDPDRETILPQVYRGDHAKGEIEILDDVGGDPGTTIVFRDQRVLLVRDHVRFPDGATGTYLRLIPRSELADSRGVVVIPLWKGDPVFLRIFRHPTRTWEWELPRGFGEPDIPDEQNAHKEAREELGVATTSARFLGEIHPDSGLLATTVSVYAVQLAENPENREVQATREAIASARCVPAKALPKFVAEAPVRCGFSLAALWLWQASKPELDGP